jgi:predicted nuclease of predicted toxin-antitoxin system
MRFLADENIPLPLVQALRRAGHDVEWAGDDLSATPDEEIVTAANSQGRMLMTFDVRLASSVHLGKLSVLAGVVLLRLPAISQAALNATVISALREADSWRGSHVVVTPDRIRVTRLP